jgi:dTDP-4-dehydrorhamnose reductase
MLRLMRASGTVRVVADQVGTPTSANSVAAMIWKVLARPELAGIHHWTDAGVASWYDLAVAIAEEGSTFGLVPPDVNVAPIGTEQYPTPARRPQYSVLDTSSLLGVGLTPLHWRKALRQVLQEIRDA